MRITSILWSHLYLKMGLLVGLLIFVSTLNACSETSPPQPQTKNTNASIIEPKELTNPISANLQSYSSFLQSVKTKRQDLASRTHIRVPTLYNWIHNDMASHWDDTEWDFNGISRKAGKGEIACGYFVTTILQDLGFEIDRIRLAQARSAVMIEELTAQIKITHSREDMVAYVKTQPVPAIYIVGLDFHTGFISSGADGIYFIHSNYIGREGVVKEPAATSLALADSNYFMLGNLTANFELLEIWSSKP